ncbi:hypothetical protein V2K79_12440 [Pseudomonas alliivorans]|nr:hypothetical protein [Pseudomonas alliivorans]MEE4752864.1 hypothetical protein [Pseudomonas alliivorans]MEE4962279.1 hypothetical protein [Pseudomonas alliivorans]MEE4970472.1 hypothetical protein [Pseudomonas alliivorans]MEE5001521.1 hypothetical protein [Pseudomonas alliivorans]
MALSAALTLPDVCGSLIHPLEKIGVRYERWFDSWMSLKHTTKIPYLYKEFLLSGRDCYALRCTYLHEGSGDITARKTRALDDFHFICPPPNQNSIHLNKINDTLQVQVDIFCMDMAGSVDEWASSVAEDAEVQKRISSLLLVHDWAPGIKY